MAPYHKFPSVPLLPAMSRGTQTEPFPVGLRISPKRTRHDVVCPCPSCILEVADEDIDNEYEAAGKYCQATQTVPNVEFTGRIEDQHKYFQSKDRPGLLESLPVIENKESLRNSETARKWRDLQLPARLRDHAAIEKDKIKTGLESIGMFTLKTAAISGAILGGVSLAVPAIGFTAGGVAAGSAAAAYQSAFLGGLIAKGSAFAVLQSVGAAGLATSTQLAVVAATAAGNAAVHIVKNIAKK